MNFLGFFHGKRKSGCLGALLADGLRTIQGISINIAGRIFRMYVPYGSAKTKGWCGISAKKAVRHTMHILSKDCIMPFGEKYICMTIIQRILISGRVRGAQKLTCGMGFR